MSPNSAIIWARLAVARSFLCLEPFSPWRFNACPSFDHHPAVSDLQGAQLHDRQEQEERSGPDGDQEVLPPVPEAHGPPGDQVACPHPSYTVGADRHRGVAQLVEQRSPKPRVGRSSRSTPARLRYNYHGQSRSDGTKGEQSATYNDSRAAPGPHPQLRGHPRRAPQGDLAQLGRPSRSPLRVKRTGTLCMPTRATKRKSATT